MIDDDAKVEFQITFLDVDLLCHDRLRSGQYLFLNGTDRNDELSKSENADSDGNRFSDGDRPMVSCDCHTPAAQYTDRLPTKDMKPDIGEVLLEDVFLNENFWQTFRSDQGNAVISNNELTLAIQFSAGSIASFLDYHPKADYYLSVDVTLPICSDSSDYYGVFFRYGDKDNYDRFLINCQGQTRVEQRYGGKMLPLADWSVTDKFARADRRNLP